MDSRALIDAQFDRAVEIVQSLPKNGPIQTGYEEKLTMYSLYKQATVGNVQSPRPSVWDMLGRAKWDAWAKHKELDSYEAKWLYVDALLKVLRRYSDKTVAMDLVRELESYTGDPSNLVMSGSLPRPGSAGSSSSGSTASDDRAPAHYPTGQVPAHLRQSQTSLPSSAQISGPQPDESSSDEDEAEDDVPPVPSAYAQSQMNRPQSSLSSHRYRTPMAGSLLLSPPLPMGASVPATQPLPGYQMQSAFAEPSSNPSTTYPASTSSYPGPLPHSSTTDLTSSMSGYPPHPIYRTPSQQQRARPYASYSGMTPRPASRPTLERAIENVQAHLAALTERIESLEGFAHRSTASLSSRGATRSPQWVPTERGEAGWDFDDMGLWTLVIQPLARVVRLFKYLINILLRQSQNRSPTFVILRRLFLDISFILCLLAVAKMAWRRSGMRRREVIAALGGLWSAIVGPKQPRILVDRAV
ncbi:hypothetical protein AcW1_004609 [Taiwanofungus camphoratus]|nr:hypothetical protein AcV5_000995 [Antrodia cinnamomea]KAI0952566.1 hypothetical protein AcV7_008323 [Antrodia cinnamomea]KAI0959936.1 hypothetical protein AcW1_004609 [Antrodia cinnamomea]